jgi:hypothetical protein
MKIVLLGHRKHNGKDICSAMIKEILGEDVIEAKFSRMVKKLCAIKYDLEFKRMDDSGYKESKPLHLGGRTVRQVLIEESVDTRKIWKRAWAYHTYKQIFKCKEFANYAVVSDFRYPVEFDEFGAVCELLGENPNDHQLIRVLVDREGYLKDDDGADEHLSDDPADWDFHLVNRDGENWKENLYGEVMFLVDLIIGDEQCLA